MVEKQTIPHLKALIGGILNPEDWGLGIIISLPQPHFVKIHFLGEEGVASS